MTTIFDTSNLSQAANRKVTPHDNCIVTELSSGSFPRYIDIRLPDDDGALQTALWDGSLDLEVNDEVLCHEYANISVWRIMAMGGNDSGAGKQRVSKVWESDFGNVTLQADASGRVGIGDNAIASPDAILEIDNSVSESVPVLALHGKISSGEVFEIDTLVQTSLSPQLLRFVSQIEPGGVLTNFFGVNVNPLVGGASSNNISNAPIFHSRIRFTDTWSGTVSALYGYQSRVPGDIGAGTPAVTTHYGFFCEDLTFAATNWAFYAAGTTPSFFGGDVYINSNAGIGTSSPLAQLHVDQVSTTAAQPVLLLDQADISEEMRQFETTIGVGNAIEAVGSKLLTVTHFVKDTLPGGLTRYTPYGTISTTGPKFTKNETVTTQGLGANPDIFAFGFYEFNAADANLDEGGTTQTFGTANISYAAHAFAVTGGAGATDAGVVGLRVNGTSINDQGTRTPGDTETIIADITAAVLDNYQETSKKWLGTVTYELFTVSGAPTVFSLDFNYGLAKYDDWFNTDFTITDIEADGFAGANDAAFDIKLMHHQSSGWTYSAAAFTPITAANTVASLATDHSTDDQLASSQHASWKRDNLSEAIDGADSEGFLIFISSSANNAIEYLNLHVGVIF